MPANWTAPEAYTTGQLVTAANMNKLSDNISYLMSKPDTKLVTGSSSDFSTTSTTFVDVTGFTVTYTKRHADSRLVIWLRGVLSGGAAPAYFAVNVNATDYDLHNG